MKESSFNFPAASEEFLAEDAPFRCFRPEDLGPYVRVRNAGIANGQPWETEARLLGKDGQYRWFLYRANPLRDEQGRVIRWYLARRDIEDRNGRVVKFSRL